MNGTISVFFIAVSLFLSEASVAQVATGTPPFSSIAGGPFDSVNTGNLNVHFAIPIFNKAGRGMPFVYVLSYDSSIWNPTASGSSQTWTPAANWGWQSPYGGTAGVLTDTSTTTYCTSQINGHRDGSVTTVTNWAYHDQWGVVHPFPGELVQYSDTDPQCTGTDITAFTSTATDGSGLVLTLPGGR